MPETSGANQVGRYLCYGVVMAVIVGFMTPRVRHISTVNRQRSPTRWMRSPRRERIRVDALGRTATSRDKPAV